jgi:hypothetical protein
MNRFLLAAAMFIAPGIACLGQTNLSLAADLPTPCLTLKPPPETAQFALAIAPATPSSQPINPINAASSAATEKERSSPAQEPSLPGHIFPLPELTTHDLPIEQKDSEASPRSIAGVAASDQLFAAADLKLRRSPVGNQEATGLSRLAGPVSDQMDVRFSRSDLDVISRVSREGLLQSPEPVFRREIAQKMAAAFAPQIIHVGHVRIYSSIVTAIARKNPLCLLDPQFFNISF